MPERQREAKLRKLAAVLNQIANEIVAAAALPKDPPAAAPQGGPEDDSNDDEPEERKRFRVIPGGKG